MDDRNNKFNLPYNQKIYRKDILAACEKQVLECKSKQVLTETS